MNTSDLITIGIIGITLEAATNLSNDRYYDDYYYDYYDIHNLYEPYYQVDPFFSPHFQHPYLGIWCRNSFFEG